MPDNAIELKIDARKLTDDRFEKAIGAFFDLLRSVADNVIGRERAVRWIIEVEAGSAIVRARADSDAEALPMAQRSIDLICSGVSALTRGESTTPPFFTNVSLRAARTLASVHDAEGEYVNSVTVKNGSAPIELTSQVVATVDDILGEKYEALGSVEGQVQMISERHGFKLAIYDVIFDQPVICYPKTEQIKDEAMRAFGKRVIVAGEVRYRRDGKPSSVVAESVLTFQDESELPSLADVQRIYATN